jgi:hypothetical protein
VRTGALRWVGPHSPSHPQNQQHSRRQEPQSLDGSHVVGPTPEQAHRPCTASTARTGSRPLFSKSRPQGVHGTATHAGHNTCDKPCSHTGSRHRAKRRVESPHTWCTNWKSRVSACVSGEACLQWTLLKPRLVYYSTLQSLQGPWAWNRHSPIRIRHQKRMSLAAHQRYTPTPFDRRNVPKSLQFLGCTNDLAETGDCSCTCCCNSTPRRP